MRRKQVELLLRRWGLTWIVVNVRKKMTTVMLAVVKGVKKNIETGSLFGG